MPDTPNATEYHDTQLANRKGRDMLRTLCGAIVAAAGVFLASGAAEALLGQTTWSAVEKLGLPTTFAVLAFLGMGSWILKQDRDRQRDIDDANARMQTLDKFQRDTLVKISLQSTAAMERMQESTERCIAVTEKLAHTIELMRIRFRLRPCLALDMLSDEDRRRVQAILDAASLVEIDDDLGEDDRG